MSSNPDLKQIPFSPLAFPSKVQCITMQGYFNGLDESEMLATRADLILKQTPPGLPADKMRIP